MRKKKYIYLLVLLMVMFATVVEAKKRVVKAVGGTPIPGFSIAIDASYDPKLDNFVPGYKMLNVLIINNSLNIIGLNPQKDRWSIKVKDSHKKHEIIGDLRSQDAAAWNSLPARARSLISYPLLLPIGARQVVDVFVPEDVAVENFSELIVYLDSLKTTFEILARQ